MRFLTLVAALSLLAVVLPPAAQTAVGTVNGTVKNPSGVHVDGVVVRIIATGSSPYSTVSDAQGAFTFRRVPIGDYELTATLTGFARFSGRLTVSAGKTARVEVVLRPAPIYSRATSHSGVIRFLPPDALEPALAAS